MLFINFLPARILLVQNLYIHLGIHSPIEPGPAAIFLQIQNSTKPANYPVWKT
jgi:hypothetical protein